MGFQLSFHDGTLTLTFACEQPLTCGVFKRLGCKSKLPSLELPNPLRPPLPLRIPQLTPPTVPLLCGASWSLQDAAWGVLGGSWRAPELDPLGMNGPDKHGVDSSPLLQEIPQPNVGPKYEAVEGASLTEGRYQPCYWGAGGQAFRPCNTMLGPVQGRRKDPFKLKALLNTAPPTRTGSKTL